VPGPDGNAWSDNVDRKRVLILGAAGRDFHDFNVLYRHDPAHEVVGFTAAQIPNIDDRRYPATLAGPYYPEGIPIFPEHALADLIDRLAVELCVFAYSDMPYARVMHLGAIANAAGADFMLVGARRTMLKSRKPVIAVVATRTGAGKSQTCRRLVELMSGRGLRTVTIRHPMPYGDLAAQRVQRFASVDDLVRHGCTIEEMEEYEPHIERGQVVYAGVDFAAILEAAESDPGGCDVVLWDGGNNDTPFLRPDLTITVADPHRAGHELSYYAGEVNLRLADVIVINKLDSAPPDRVQILLDNIHQANPAAVLVRAESRVSLGDAGLVAGQRVLVVEDGPTLTHGEMASGAGMVAALAAGAADIVDPRPFAVGSIASTLSQWPHIGRVLPAMGYGAEQRHDLEATIAACDCDSVVIGTPIDLSRVIRIDKPNTRVHYELAEIGRPDLADVLDRFIDRHAIKPNRA
jgi:predicted GTPase